MDIEKLIGNIVDSDSNQVEDYFFEVLSEHWVYFYFNEASGNDTKPGNGNVDVVVFPGKDNPINLPMVENELGQNGVIYTSLDLALRLSKIECKIGKMKGKNALKMLYELEGFGGLYIQADSGFIYLNKAQLAKVVG